MHRWQGVQRQAAAAAAAVACMRIPFGNFQPTLGSAKWHSVLQGSALQHAGSKHKDLSQPVGNAVAVLAPVATYCCFPHGLSIACVFVQGSGIEPVITYLRKWLRIERTRIGSLLWSYPLDYSLPRLVLPSQAPTIAATMDEATEEAAANESSSSSSCAASSSEASPAEQGQQPPVLPPIGSAERCTWLVLPPDSDAEEGGSSSSSGAGSSQ